HVLSLDRYSLLKCSPQILDQGRLAGASPTDKGCKIWTECQFLIREKIDALDSNPQDSGMPLQRLRAYLPMADSRFMIQKRLSEAFNRPVTHLQPTEALTDPTLVPGAVIFAQPLAVGTRNDRDRVTTVPLTGIVPDHRTKRSG